MEEAREYEIPMHEDKSELTFDETFFRQPKERYEQIVMTEMARLEVSETNQARLIDDLGLLEAHNLPTYLHSLRVGIMASRIGHEVRLDPKPLFIAGLLHDFGKLAVMSEVLDKKEGFDETDYEYVKRHVEKGYEYLAKHFAYSAEILVRHHAFGDHPYPEKIPDSTIFSEKNMKKINELARFLSLIDFYDAISSRRNDKFKGKVITPQEKKAMIIDGNKDVEDLIEDLYTKGLFI